MWQNAIWLTVIWLISTFRFVLIKSFLSPLVGKWDIEFFNFCHCQVQNFEISNMFKWNQNFAVIFRKYRKQNQKLTKYITTKQKQNIIPLTFHEILLVLWNLVNFGKILQFLVKFSKSLKDLWKIMLKWLGETVKYWLNFNNFC